MKTLLHSGSPAPTSPMEAEIAISNTLHLHLFLAANDLSFLTRILVGCGYVPVVSIFENDEQSERVSVECLGPFQEGGGWVSGYAVLAGIGINDAL